MVKNGLSRFSHASVTAKSRCFLTSFFSYVIPNSMVPTHHCIIWIFHYRHALILQRIMERPFIRGPPKKVGEIGPLSSQLLKSPSVPSGLHAETGRAPCNNSRAYQALEIKHWRRIWFHIVYFPKLLAQNSRCVVMPPLEVVEFVSMLVSPTNSEEFPLYPIQTH